MVVGLPESHKEIYMNRYGEPTPLFWILVIVISLAIGAVAAFVVKILWNFAVSPLFGLPEASFWQAWGLLILCSLLFKGIRISSRG